MSAQFTRIPHPAPVPEARRAEIVADPGFGRHFTDHMVTIGWTAGRGWHDPAVVPYGPIALDPASMVLHYGQEIFEGLKAYQQPDGSVASFRPDANAARFRGLGGAAGDGAAARRAVPGLAHRAAHRGPRLGAAVGWRGVGVPAPVHDRHRGRAGRAAVVRVPLPAHRLARRAVLPGRCAAGRRLAVHRLHPRGARWHRHREVRRQLRRVAAPAGPGGRARLRTGRLPRRRRAHLGGGDGRHEPVLRVRVGAVGRAGDARAVRQHPARHHPRLAARAGQGAGLPGHRAPDLRAGVARRVRGRPDQRGVRLRHRGGDHTGRAGEAQRRRGDGRPTASPVRSRPGCGPCSPRSSAGSAPDTHSWMRTVVPA